MRFRRTRHGIEAKVDDVEVRLLQQLTAELLTLLDAGPAGRDADPLEAIVGLPAVGAEPELPADPALARLFPDAYPDDDGAAREFRRFTESDLRAAKSAAARTVLDTLDGTAGRVVLDEPAAEAWLTTLNDLRLTLGTRLGVTEDTDLEHLDPNDPDGQALSVYSWLGWTQETLVAALAPG